MDFVVPPRMSTLVHSESVQAGPQAKEASQGLCLGLGLRVFGGCKGYQGSLCIFFGMFDSDLESLRELLLTFADASLRRVVERPAGRLMRTLGRLSPLVRAVDFSYAITP